MVQELKTPERIRILLEHTGEVQPKIDDFFVETKNYLESKYGKSPFFEIRSENFEKSDNRLTYLIYNDNIVAGVVERRTEFNNAEFSFFRDFSRLEKKFQNYNNP